MTRDAKIGLLVGLLFFIMIGILLMQYLTSTNEPVPADIAKFGNDVRDTLATPTPGADENGSPIVVSGAPTDQPSHVVPTRDDLRSFPQVKYVPMPPRTAVPTPDNQQAQVPGDAAVPNPVQSQTPLRQTPPDTDGGQASGRVPSSPIHLPPGASELLRQHPDELAAVNPGGNAPMEGVRPPVTQQQTEYTAVSGDSLSRIASRQMGGNTKANRDALMAANPSLQGEDAYVIAGRAYVIPRAVKAGAPAAQSPVAHGGAAAAPTAEPARYYTVKGNDSLWKIAEAELGNGNAWMTIRDLNKDVLKGGETVHPEMRLRLPARSAVAGAND